MGYSVALQACSRMKKRIALEPPLQRSLKRIETKLQVTKFKLRNETAKNCYTGRLSDFYLYITWYFRHRR